MNILLLGSGGREHAFAWKLAQSKRLTKLFIAPGNPGTSSFGENVSLNPLDFEAVKQFVSEYNVSIVVVGPEEPLVKGISDAFAASDAHRSVTVIGPSAAGAQLEGSKDFSKAFMMRHKIPTARYQSFTPATLDEGKAFLRTMEAPFVLKASGLAAGKGVVIPETLEEAEQELEEMLGGKFGAAGNVVVIEEFLKGVECSVFVLSDGNSAFLLPEAKDHKRIGEGNTGLNTGGMGAFSPVPFCDEVFMDKVKSRIIEPTMNGLKAEGIDYKGFIFIGLMSVNGEPFVIEYNCRMGDPETEVVLPRLENDLVELFESVGNGTLHNHQPKISALHAATVVVVSGGYPGDYPKGFQISGLDRVEGELVFHAGTKQVGDQLVTNGGRVLAFTSLGESREAALARSYKSINEICYEGIYYRKDIGKVDWVE
jgi:phosphoribosylamine--glycine ligase